MAINRDLLNATLDVIRQSLQTDGGDVELGIGSLKCGAFVEYGCPA